MEYKKIDSVYAVRLEPGEEIVASLAELCEKEKIMAATVQGIGAVNDVNIGYYSLEEKRYFPERLKKQFEMISLNGNITRKDGCPYLHLHIALSDENYNLYGGHLNSAVISITAEIYINILNGEINRRVNPETSLNILDI